MGFLSSLGDMVKQFSAENPAAAQQLLGAAALALAAQHIAKNHQ